jgi:hypothetical protein
MKRRALGHSTTCHFDSLTANDTSFGRSGGRHYRWRAGVIPWYPRCPRLVTGWTDATPAACADVCDDASCRERTLLADELLAVQTLGQR